MTVQKFEFEGKQMTVAEINKLVPCMSNNAVRQALKNGRNTRQKMLCYDANRGRAATSRENGEKLRRQMWNQAGFKE
jgi:hypothetical protein